MSGLTHHYETSAPVAAPRDKVFAYVDDPTRLGSHMSKSSWMMGGSRMQIELDDGLGQQCRVSHPHERQNFRSTTFTRGSRDRTTISPHRKVWETIWCAQTFW